jgi:hypothetical protein
MDRSRFGRGLAILAVAALAVAVVSPAFSAAPLTKAKVKKIAKKQINKLVPGIAIEETELHRFGLITMNIGDAAQTVGTLGPFTLTATCTDGDPAADVDISAQLEITTTEDNSIAASDDDNDNDFDSGDAAVIWAGGDFENTPGGVVDYWSEESEGHAASPSGIALDGRSAVYFNFAGAHCAFAGYLIQTAPQ